MSAKKKTSKTRKTLIHTAAVSLTSLIMIGLVAGAAAFIVYSVRKDHRELGQYNVSDPFISQDIYKSLDLKLSSKAAFPSSAISIAKTLLPSDGLSRQVFSFNVMDDHLTEYGLLVLPTSQRPPQGYPVVILLHGYANPQRYQTDTAYLSEMEAYASQGFAVLKPDLRGQGLSMHSGHADSAYYSMSYNTDVLSLISAVKQTPGFDSGNISLWGHSMGAYLALRAAVISKDIKDVILLSAPADSLREMYLTYIPPSDENNPYALATRSEVFSKYGTPEENTRFWHDASPIYFLGRIHAAVQIYVGLDDQVVPPRFSQDLDQAFTAEHIKHQYYEYPDAGHSLEDQRPVIYDKSIKLMRASASPAS